MRIINDYYYLIEPKDSLDEIKYLINLGCAVLGYFSLNFLGHKQLYLLHYSKYGALLEHIKFKKYSKDSIEDWYEDYSHYYIKW